MEKLPAIKITQVGQNKFEKAVELYISAMTLSQLDEFTDIDIWRPTTPNGYQREPTPRRLREIANYILKGRATLPSAILLAVRPDTDPAIALEGFEKTDSPGVKSGNVLLPRGTKLWMVDGQHRFGGALSAWERDGVAEMADFPFPVVIMWQVDQFDEMLQFSKINTEQKKMQTDVVDRHMERFLTEKGPDWIKNMAPTTQKGQKQLRQARTTRVIDSLNASGVWKDKVIVPGDPNKTQGLVRQHALVASLDTFMSDLAYEDSPQEEQVLAINTYWSAIADLCSEAIERPADYRLQATVGIYSLHMVLPSVIQACNSRGGMKLDIVKSVLKETGDTDEKKVFVSDFWSKDPSVGDPLTLGTGMASIRALAQTIRTRLPRPSSGIQF